MCKKKKVESDHGYTRRGGNRKVSREEEGERGVRERTTSVDDKGG